jgi:hypothetical protein
LLSTDECFPKSSTAVMEPHVEFVSIFQVIAVQLP